jgi:hypothetical protein
MAPETTGAATGRHFPLGGGLAQNGHFRDFGRGAPPLREYAGYANKNRQEHGELFVD